MPATLRARPEQPAPREPRGSAGSARSEAAKPERPADPTPDQPCCSPTDSGQALAAKQARAILQAADQARVAEAQRLIQQALEQTRCLVLPEITITGDRLTTTIRILPRA